MAPARKTVNERGTSIGPRQNRGACGWPIGRQKHPFRTHASPFSHGLRKTLPNRSKRRTPSSPKPDWYREDNQPRRSLSPRRPATSGIPTIVTKPERTTDRKAPVSVRVLQSCFILEQYQRLVGPPDPAIHAGRAFRLGLSLRNSDRDVRPCGSTPARRADRRSSGDRREPARQSLPEHPGAAG